MSTSQQFYKFKGRKSKDRKTLPALTEEQRADMRAKASCFIIVKFADGNTILRWSKEFQHPKKTDLNYWVNDWMRVFDTYWKSKAISAAIYDARYVKTIIKDKTDPNFNKLYQYNDKQWEAVSR